MERLEMVAPAEKVCKAVQVLAEARLSRNSVPARVKPVPAV